MEFSIESLSQETCKPAYELICRALPPQNKGIQNQLLSASINPEEYGHFLKERCISQVKYWTANKPETKEVIGIIGEYSTTQSQRDLWIISFCVDEKFRNKGIGSMLLNHVIGLANREELIERVVLMTSDRPERSEAIKLYKKTGFVLAAKEPGKKGFHDLYYRLDLKTKL